MIEEIKLSKEEETNVIARVMALESDWDASEAENISEAQDDLDMLNGEQWTARMNNIRGNRVKMTVNKLIAPVKRISNEFRQNSIGIRITPQESNDKAMARIRQGLIRNIEKISNAKAIYSATFDSAVSCGFGYYRILSDYKSYDSNDQDIKIEMINNAFSVKMDHRRKWVWGHDAKWCIINDELSHDEFKYEFPDSDMVKNNAFKNQIYGVDWLGSNTIKVVEFFDCKYKKESLLTLKDGSTILESKYTGGKRQIESKRTTMVPYVHWYKMTCHEVLSHSILPIKYIPVICMPGEVAWIKDKRVLRSLIRFAKDSQRAYNIHKSNAMEKNEMAPKAPFMVTPTQVAGYEDMYAQANTKNFPFLYYNPDPQAPGAPQRMGYVNQSAGDERLAMEDADDIKTITGVYDPALGAQSNETSGVAIRARSGQSQTINYNFHDNAAMAVQYGAQIINDWIPHVYDSERVIRILGEGERDEIVKINSSDPSDPLSRFSSDDERYDVNVEVGPAYQTQMQEAFETIVQLLPQMSPAERTASFDVAMGNLNFVGADTLQKRYRKIIEMTQPQLLEDEDNQNKAPDDPEVLKAELSKADQVINEMQQALQMSEQVMSQLQSQVAQLSDQNEKQILLEQVKHKNKMEELEFTEAVKMKVTEMQNASKLETPLMNSLIQTGQAAMLANQQSQAPAYVEQELRETYSEDESPEMGAEYMSEQDLPAESPGQFPEMEQMQ